ncbi:MAG: bifunctional adenosylcobinamide kinase/adenosylcobinamide-phosphate guanylyltransferase [Cyanobacteria bacterium J069]|nr:MAG: bifunctional adenosylcobinamide kinase/adenosylcobinamide-phosphate guanylyltransferase [Cyanobacteria bacterium J069]
MAVTLVTGPSRSGKSEWAEYLAQGRSPAPVIYVATAQRRVDDAEWQARIDQHQQRRPAEWRAIEEPVALAAVLSTAAAGECWLVDALGTWLANLLEQEETEWQTTVADLLTVLQQTPAEVILVAEETGWGIVPAYPAGRLFRDRLGALTRRIGAIAHTVYLVTGGYALDLSRLGVRLPEQGG